MLLATTTVEDYDRFVDIFSTKGADKRRQHGSKGSTVFRDPNESDRVWAIFDWDAEGWQSFASDPEVPGIMQEAGHKGGHRCWSSAARTTPRRSTASSSARGTDAERLLRLGRAVLELSVVLGLVVVALRLRLYCARRADRRAVALSRQVATGRAA